MRKNFILVAVFIAMVVLIFSGCTDQSKSKESKYLEIRGVISEVDYIAEGSSFNASDIIQTIIKFEDGRIKAFDGISKEIFYRGKENIIYYTKGNRIVEVKIVEN